jgi:hypothetical protein
MALPTAKRKEGNTRSVGVKPSHSACSRGAKATGPYWLLTMIMEQSVMPLKTSRAVNLCVIDIMQFVG